MANSLDSRFKLVKNTTFLSFELVTVNNDDIILVSAILNFYDVKENFKDHIESTIEWFGRALFPI